MVIVQSQFCPQNHRCPTLRACPTGALRQEGFNAPTIDAESCIECGRCVSSCRVFKETATASIGGDGALSKGGNGASPGILERLLRRTEV